MLKIFTKNLFTQKKLVGEKSGFSLPELIVVIAIFTIISSVAMFNQGKLSSSVLLTNMAYEVGLAIREAQTYGIGVRSEDLGASFTGQYGAHFSTQDENQSRQIIVFADQSDANGPPNFRYDPGEEKYIYQFENQRGNKISVLCAGDIDTSANEACTSDLNSPKAPQVASILNELDVFFKRPNPSALIYDPIDQVGGTGNPVQQIGRAYIVVSSLAGDDCRVVVVEPTGQIRVEDSSNGLCEVTNP